MTEKTIPNEQAIIAEILRRKGSPAKGIPSEKMQIFKARLGAEIKRTGSLREGFVDDLLQKLKNGEL
jgi:hypothetical protein